MFEPHSSPIGQILSNILVTGAAGFIGFHLCRRLLADGHRVLGIDNLNSYYDPALKQHRTEQLEHLPGFRFHRQDIFDRDGLMSLFADERPDVVVNLAAQAGVRYSISDPHSYADSNLTGFLNVLEACRRQNVGHLVYASSSSVYGANAKAPFSVTDAVDRPLSLYAATKRANELMAYTYSHLYGLPVTGLRLFTVYGPWGRPDMAYFSFTRDILEGRPINLHNNGQMLRDFTYVEDIVTGISLLIGLVPHPTDADPVAYRLYNIGSDAPTSLLQFVATLEDVLGKKAIRNLLPMQPGDVPATHADISELVRDTGFRPAYPLRQGLTEFVTWYRDYYHI
ncbi:MAG: NAD-dependent epimerase/dehydratase family protein [Flavobacteriales bacterium]|nr:NAD-dependent epimerase/dehydratase family protein [Flavobacteriales bacterium]